MSEEQPPEDREPGDFDVEDFLTNSEFEYVTIYRCAGGALDIDTTITDPDAVLGILRRALTQWEQQTEMHAWDDDEIEAEEEEE